MPLHDKLYFSILLLIRAVKQQISCKPPPERKTSLVVIETPRGIGSDGTKNAVLVSKADQPQRPVAPPRTNLKLKSPGVERPIPGKFLLNLAMLIFYFL